MSRVLKVWGLKINTHDDCVENEKIYGYQCTILWHVDDMKILHIDTKVVGGVIKQLNQRYCKDPPLTVTRLRVREYPRKTIDLSN